MHALLNKNNKAKTMSDLTPESYTKFVRRLFNRSDDSSKDFAHAVLGVVTEIHEFRTAEDATNALEELGDIEFFVEALAQVVSDVAGDRPTLQQTDIDTLAAEVGEDLPATEFISNTCNELCDHVKRWVGYGKAPTDLHHVWRLAAVAGFCANAVSHHANLDRQAVREANVRKLLKRYPGGEFSQFHALVRDKGAEREAINQST